MVLRIVVVVVVSSPSQSPRCGVRRVEKVWKFWLPTMSVGNPAAKRQLPFGSQNRNSSRSSRRIQSSNNCSIQDGSSNVSSKPGYICALYN